MLLNLIKPIDENREKHHYINSAVNQTEKIIPDFRLLKNTYPNNIYMIKTIWYIRFFKSFSICFHPEFYLRLMMNIWSLLWGILQILQTRNIQWIAQLLRNSVRERKILLIFKMNLVIISSYLRYERFLTKIFFLMQL